MVRLAALLVVAVMLVAGCSDDGSTPPRWDGPPQPLADDGTLPIDGFNSYLEAVSEPWEGSAVGVATAYALPLVGDSQTLAAASAPEGSSPVTLTIGGLLDDSVAARQLRFALTRDGERWTVSEASWAQRCRPGRGHQDFSPEPCV